jgi:hypothetical protein
MDHDQPFDHDHPWLFWCDGHRRVDVVLPHINLLTGKALHHWRALRLSSHNDHIAGCDLVGVNLILLFLLVWRMF